MTEADEMSLLSLKKRNRGRYGEGEFWNPSIICIKMSHLFPAYHWEMSHILAPKSLSAL